MLSTVDRHALLGRVDTLRQSLAVLPSSEVLQKAIYYCERLHLAIRTSHSEGTRFAAFTIKKIVRDHAAELPPAISVMVQEIAAALESQGIDLQK